jgi:uncharacterized protein YhfF
MTYLPDGCAKPDQAALEAFWQAAQDTLPESGLPNDYQVRWIGLDAESTWQIFALIRAGDKTGTFTLPWIGQIFALIRAGDKTGTFTLPWIVDRTQQPTPRVGDAIILIDFDGTPTMLIRLTDIEDVPFGEITNEHTAVDGPPVRDVAIWRPLHTQYWNAMLAPFDLSVSDDMPVWIEKFEVLL